MKKPCKRRKRRSSAGGKNCRLTPAALKLLAELYTNRKDHKNLEAVCGRIIKDYPRSLEVKFAHKSLVDSLVAEAAGMTR